MAAAVRLSNHSSGTPGGGSAGPWGFSNELKGFGSREAPAGRPGEAASVPAAPTVAGTPPQGSTEVGRWSPRPTGDRDTTPLNSDGGGTQQSRYQGRSIRDINTNLW